MRPLSRTRLFLLEMLVSLLIFCVGTLICMMTLTRAYSLSADSRVMADAQRVTENAAVAFQAADGDLQQLPQILSGRIKGDTLTVWYDQEFAPVSAARGIYHLVLEAKTMPGALRQAKITVFPPEGDPIYRLTVHIYTGLDAKGGSR